MRCTTKTTIAQNKLPNIIHILKLLKQRILKLHKSETTNGEQGATSKINDSGYTNILQDKTLFCALEAGDIVCWLVNQPIAKLDLFKSPDCRWICKTYTEFCYRNSATVRRLVYIKSNFAIDNFFVVLTPIYVVKVYECHPLGKMSTHRKYFKKEQSDCICWSKKMSL